MHLVRLDADSYSIEFARQGVSLDLGAIGKGYAIDEAVYLLRESGAVMSAFIHGGTSTIYATGKPFDAEAWKVAMSYPDKKQGTVDQNDILAVVSLEDEALSVSAVKGKSFQVNGKEYGHVLDPRSGWPVDGALQAAVVLPSATESDALSTALLVLGKEGMDLVANYNQTARAVVVRQNQMLESLDVFQKGIPLY